MYDVARELARAIEFHRTGRFHEAEAVYRQVLQADAANAQAPYLLAALCDTTGRVDEAVSQLMCLLERQPDHAAAQNHLGAILADRDELDAAIAHFEAALRAKPTWNEPRQNLTKALAARFNRQGVELAAEGKLELAVTCYREALAVQPNDVAAQGNLGNALRLQGNWVEAEVCYRRVLALVPDSAEAHYSLGVARGHLLRWDDANLHLRRAIELQPDYVDAHGALGRVMLEQGLADDALVCFRRNVELAPNSADAHFRLAFALMLTGRFAEGWREYEWRLVGKELDGPPLAQPRWDGSPLAGRTILVRCEQGYGDTLQFIRFAELLKRQGASVIVECRAPLVRILATCAGVDRVVERGATRPQFDLHAPLLSLPGILGITLENPLARCAYLTPDEASVAKWQTELAGDPSFKIGVAWQGDPAHPNNRARSFRFAQLAPIARMPGVRLYSLQLESGREQLSGVADTWPIADLSEGLTDFHETAALMRGLDLVIACDSAVAHLAGAVGVPVWTALCFAPDWRWLLEREDSPWYPTMRLFRQPRPADWDDVFRRMAIQLAEMV